MNKKKFGVAFVLIGVLILVGAGCGNNSLTDAQNQINVNSTNLCDSAKEIEAPNDQAKELKKIFSEAGGEIKLISNIQPDSSAVDTLVYVWKNKPKAEELESAFKKYGYKVEISGLIMIAQKGDITISVSSTEGLECQEVVVSITDEPLKLGGKVTTEECAKLLVYTRNADVRNHDFATALANAIPLYKYWDMLAQKYGVIRDVIAKDCEAKVNWP